MKQWNLKYSVILYVLFQYKLCCKQRHIGGTGLHSVVYVTVSRSNQVKGGPKKASLLSRNFIISYSHTRLAKCGRCCVLLEKHGNMVTQLPVMRNFLSLKNKLGYLICLWIKKELSCLLRYLIYFHTKYLLHSPDISSLDQCFSTSGPRSGTGPWHQLHRATRGLRKLQYAARFR